MGRFFLGDETSLPEKYFDIVRKKTVLLTLPNTGTETVYIVDNTVSF